MTDLLSVKAPIPEQLFNGGRMACKVTSTTLQAVANFCRGKVGQKSALVLETNITITENCANGALLLIALIGDWVYQDAEGKFGVLSAEQFDQRLRALLDSERCESLRSLQKPPAGIEVTSRSPKFLSDDGYLQLQYLFGFYTERYQRETLESVIAHAYREIDAEVSLGEGEAVEILPQTYFATQSTSLDPEKPEYHFIVLRRWLLKSRYQVPVERRVDAEIVSDQDDSQLQDLQKAQTV